MLEWKWYNEGDAELTNDILISCNVHFAGDKIEKNEMGWACGAYGWEKGGVKGLRGETGGKETTGET